MLQMCFTTHRLLMIIFYELTIGLRRIISPSFCNITNSVSQPLNSARRLQFFLLSCLFPQKLQVAKTARWQKLIADLFSPKPQPTTKKKIPQCRALPDLMPPLDKSPSPVGGRQRNSRATQIYPSTTLPAKKFVRFALLSMK